MLDAKDEPVEEEKHPSVIAVPTTKLSTKMQQSDNTETQAFINSARDLMLSKNKQINLYGKVLDQYNQPVTDAEIIYSIKFYDGIVRGDYGSVIENYKIYTDDGGGFAILNQLGVHVGILSIKKSGYEFTRIPDESDYDMLTYTFLKGASIPKKITADSPVVFNGWKIEEKPERYFQETSVVYGFDSGETYTINFLKNGAKLNGNVEGDLRVTFERGGDMVRDKPSWHVRLEAVNGGFIETSDTYMYQAPEDGYSQVWEYGHNHTDTDYTSMKTVSFYLKSRNGQVHTRLNMDVRPFYGKRPVIITDYFANPTGSRSLYSKRR